MKDPATGRNLPDSAIQRVLFQHQPVHIYGIPPLTSTSGFSASSWTSPTAPTAQQIFTARLRILETSIDGRIKSDIVLEDPNTGDLFAAAPYTSPAVVQQANDSSRFFAVRVVGEGGMKATLGIGFEDRSPAFDFGIALTDARKVLGLEQSTGAAKDGAGRAAQLQKKMEADAKKDFSLKEGEKIVVNVPGAGRRQKAAAPSTSSSGGGSETAALFSIAPPPPAAGVPSSSLSIQHQAAPPGSTVDGKTAQELGFDDGEFGEFQ
ncbi:putative PH-like domain superfamily, NECAP, PHear domain-containing protein [Septoria linicola]|nr:putative PH-like domain superfamily, NECAP, PHear domain-containing protein [Septoria linicola]